MHPLGVMSVRVAERAAVERAAEEWGAVQFGDVEAWVAAFAKMMKSVPQAGL